MKKFRRYNTTSGGNYSDYSGSASRHGSFNSDRSFRHQSYPTTGGSDGWGRNEDDNGWGKSGADRYEEVKNDYHQSMKARDERPAVNVDYKNYFDSSDRDRGRSPTAATEEQCKPSFASSAVAKKKWG